MKKNTFILALLFLIGCSGLKYSLKRPSEQELKLRLSKDVIPTKYDLTLWLTGKDDFTGQVTIDVDLKRGTKSILLHSQDLKILAADLKKG